MSIEDALIFPVTVATPALCVRLEIEGDHLCLHIGNDGGRGAPCLILVLPVDGDDPATLRPVIALTAALLDSHSRDRSLRCPAPYTERFSAAEWRALDLADPSNPHRLVLLLFNQSPLTGGGTVARGERHAEPATDVDKLVARIAALFEPETRDPEMLRRGLVRLDLADLPTDLPADPPTPPRGSGEPSLFTGASFAFGSCQYPAGLLDATPASAPTHRPGPADASMRRLATLLERSERGGRGERGEQGEPGQRCAPGERSGPGASAEGLARPSLLVLAGDQIYVDATAGLFDPRAVQRPAVGESAPSDNRLRVPYENWLASPANRDVLSALPTRTMLDDHEIDDNWERLPETAEPEAAATNIALQLDGVRAYRRYQRTERAEPGTAGPDPLWYAFEHRGLRFFMADTRTEREPRRAALDPLAPRIVSPSQQRALAAWLRASAGRPSFVVSPAMLVPRHRCSLGADGCTGRGALRSDAWDGYPGSMHALLALLCRERITGMVFLSGDEHLSSVTRATVTDAAGHRIVLHSVHSSGLYAPYPFANSLSADFIEHDAWRFTDPGDPGACYRVEVDVERWAPGDGFAVLSVVPGAAGGWSVGVRFDRAMLAGESVVLRA